jgi:hypothetical protein
MKVCYHPEMRTAAGSIRCIWAILGIVTCLFACQANTSLASGRSEMHGEARLSVEGTHRYRISVVISSKGALLIASKGHTAALYRTDQIRVSASHFRARFGHLGVVAVAFRPHRHGHGHRKGSACDTAGTRIERRGTFVGRIRFHGEADFTSVEASRARGTLSRTDRGGKAGCGRLARSAPTTQGGRQTRGFGLRVFSLGRNLVTFAAGRKALAEFEGWESRVGVPLGLRKLPGGRVPFTAISIESGEGVEIIRLAAGAGDKEAFVVNDEGRVAGVTPPAPFLGSAEFKMCTLRRWTGTLKVLFPGRVQPLIGEAFTALLDPSASSCAK